MRLRNLFISNSKIFGADNKFRHLIKIFGWTILWIIMIDVSIQMLFSLPKLNKSYLKRYFDYGYSTEMKLRNLFKEEFIPSNSILHAGWLNQLAQREEKKDVDIAIYGMSFAMNFANEIKKIRPSLKIRMFAGPAAPLSHSYGAYLEDRNNYRSKYVIIGILASSLKYVLAMTNDTIGRDYTMPCTYPRFKVINNKLSVTYPLINSFDDLKSTLNDTALWNRYIHQLDNFDQYYSNFLYNKSILDFSVIGRLIRRGISINHNKANTEKIHDRKGFNVNTELTEIVNQILLDFSRKARENNSIPVIILISDQGYDNHLYKMTEKTLKAQKILYVDTNDICRASDPNNFVKNGHFTYMCDAKIASSILNVIEGGN